MHRSRLGNIVIDCRTGDLLAAARFWSAALGYPLAEPLDAASGYVRLLTPPGQVQVIVQQVGHESRAHLDIETDSIEREVARLAALGATLDARHDGWVVMRAPTGQRFCVGKPYRDGFDEGATAWE